MYLYILKQMVNINRFDRYFSVKFLIQYEKNCVDNQWLNIT